MKLKEKLVERRSFVRLREPIGIAYTISGGDKVFTVTSKDLSADGVRFQTSDKELTVGNMLEMKMDIRAVDSPVHAASRVMWKKKLSLEDKAPFDVGTEFISIEEDNKNTFLKFLCDLIYGLAEEKKNAKKRKTQP